MQRNIIALTTVLMLIGPGFTLSPVLGSDPQDIIYNGESVSSASGNAIIDNTQIWDAVALDGTTLYVGGDGPGNYSRIQDAIENASDGDTVFVYDDSSPYYEDLIINKMINLIGENKETTRINGTDDAYSIISLDSNNVTIKEFTIANGHFGIYAPSETNSIKISTCIITNSSYCAIRFDDSSHVHIDNCSIYDNLEGIQLLNTSNSTIVDCTLSNRQRSISLNLNSDNNVVINCAMSTTELGILRSGIDIYSNGNVVLNCKMLNTGDGLSIYGSNNVVEDCIISDNLGRGIVFGSGENNHVLNTVVSNNGLSTDYEFYGIEFFDAFNNIIEDCHILDNPNGGIKILWLSHGNSILKSTISNNGPYGIKSTSNSNHIYSNNFLNNDIQVYDQGDNNVWDNEGLGNYWNDYNGVDEDGDGIGDTAYDVTGGDAKDNYPLMFPYGSEPNVKITTPLKGYLYIRNFKISPFFTTLIFGNIQIEANAANYVYGIDYVEFYVDGRLRSTDATPPYGWRWRVSSHIKHRHTLTVVAYDNIGNYANKELDVWKFL